MRSVHHIVASGSVEATHSDQGPLADVADVQVDITEDPVLALVFGPREDSPG